jgi:hypothetical protein
MHFSFTATGLLMVASSASAFSVPVVSRQADSGVVVVERSPTPPEGPTPLAKGAKGGAVVSSAQIPQGRNPKGGAVAPVADLMRPEVSKQHQERDGRGQLQASQDRKAAAVILR